MTSPTPVYHVITPGDHFSPRTGSALPTVVDGLARGAAADARYQQYVLVQSGTWTPRYDSADVIEYDGGPPPSRHERMLDAAAGRVGLRRPYAGRAYAPIAKRLADCPAGVVIAHNGAALLRMPALRSHRRVLYAHNDLFRSYSRSEVARVVSACDRVICVSEFLRDVMASRAPRELRDRFRVALNGVDAERFTPREERMPGPLRVLFVGRMIREKGADLLLDAASLLHRDDIEYLIVGSQGFDRSAALSGFEQDLRDRSSPGVRFMPFIDRTELPPLMRDQDVLVVPSRWPEPCSLTTGEGMASGLAIIAARSGGIPEVLADAGILVPRGDAAALAEAIKLIADDAEQRRNLTAAARARAVEHDWSHAWRTVTGALDGLR
ncbi:glycosyltransferase family 4 protein [Microbacterium profundi]